MAFTQTQKSALARLMAAEGIEVRYQPVTESDFDTEKRILTLPMLNDNLSNDIYDTLIGHEIGHALFTDQRFADLISSSLDERYGAEGNSRAKSAKKVFNILEDIRVENMIRVRYPGMKPVFSRGYNQLHREHNWFKMDRVDEMDSLTKINIAAKLGEHHEDVAKHIAFGEKMILERARQCRSTEDVLKLMLEVLDMSSPDNDSNDPDGDENQQDQNNSPDDQQDQDQQSGKNDSDEDQDEQNQQGNGEPSDEDQDEQDESGEGSEGESDDEDDEQDSETDEDQDADEGDDESDSDADDDDDSEDSDDKSEGDQGDDGDESNESDADDSDNDTENDDNDTGGDESQSSSGDGAGDDDSQAVQIQIDEDEDDEFSTSMAEFADTTSPTQNYVKFHNLKREKVVVPFSTTEDSFDYGIQSYKRLMDSYKRSMPDVDETLRILRTNVLSSSKRVVDMMVQQFNRKHAADRSRRARINSTGEINMNKLHQYKTDENIFSSRTTLPVGKSHGLFMVVDFSGSMSGCIRDTLMQVLNLVMFCKKAGIAFEVYGFTNGAMEPMLSTTEEIFGRNANMGRYNTNMSTGKVLLQGSRLFEIVNSRMTLTTYNKAVNIVCGMMAAYSGNQSSVYKTMTANMSDEQKSLVDRIPVPTTFGMGGTPLDEVISYLPGVVRQFQSESGSQIVHTIFLTDGESHSANFYSDSGSYNRVCFTSTNIVLSSGEIFRSVPDFYHNKKGYRNSTQFLLEALGRELDCNVIGFRIGSSSTADRFVSREESERMRKEYNSEGVTGTDQVAGYNQFFLIDSKSLMVSDDAEISEGKGARRSFTSVVKNRTGSRMFVNRFVDQIATK